MHFKPLLLLTACVLLSACEPKADQQVAASSPPPVTLVKTGHLESQDLLETSGLQASYADDGIFFLHNDDGKPEVFVIDASGRDLGSISIESAINRDWEDITSVPVNQERWLVLGDIGDNFTQQKHVTLYFTREPRADKNGRYAGQQRLEHTLKLTYPDGPRDSESLSYDPINKQILILSKRDKPPHLYAIDLDTALSENRAQLKFLGTISAFRKPTVADRVKWGGRVEWISQPTGFDISPDGDQAVVITYRSLYRFRRQPGEDWLTALGRKPEEVVGPPGPQNEAIAYSEDGKSIFVVSEKLPAAVFRFQFSD